MINVTAEFLEEIVKSSRRFEMQIQVGGKTIYAEDVIDWSIESQYSNSGLLGLGGVVSGKLTLNLIRSSRVPQFIAGQDIKVWIGLKVPSSDAPTWVQIGLFHPDISSATKTDSVLTIDCYDILTTLEENTSNISANYPCKGEYFVRKITEETGIAIDTTGFKGVITKAYEAGTNIRAMLSDLAELSGGNVYVDHMGVIKLNMLKVTGVTLTAANYIEFTLKSDDIIVMDGIKCNGYKAGPCANFSLSIENESVNTQALLNEVYTNAFFPKSHYAYDLTLQGMPHLTVGDAFDLIDKKGVKRKLHILTHTLKYNGGLISEFSAEVPQNETTQTGSTGSTEISDSQVDAGNYAEDGIQYGLLEHMPTGTQPVLWDINDTKVDGAIDTYDKKNSRSLCRPKNSSGYTYYATTTSDYERKESYQLKFHTEDVGEEDRTLRYVLHIAGEYYHDIYPIETVTSPFSSAPRDYTDHHFSLCVLDNILYIMTCSTFICKVAYNNTRGTAIVTNMTRFNLDTKTIIDTTNIMKRTEYGTCWFQQPETDIIKNRFLSSTGVEKLIFYVQYTFDPAELTYLDAYILEPPSASEPFVIPSYERFSLSSYYCSPRLLASRTCVTLVITFPSFDSSGDVDEGRVGYTVFELNRNTLDVENKLIWDCNSDPTNTNGDQYYISSRIVFNEWDSDDLYILETIDGTNTSGYHFRLIQYDLGWSSGIKVYPKSLDLEMPTEYATTSKVLAFIDNRKNIVLCLEDLSRETMHYMIFKNSKKGEQITGEYYKSACKGSYNTDHFISYAEYNIITGEVFMTNHRDQHFFETLPNLRRFKAGYPITKACKLYWAYDTRTLYMNMLGSYLPIIEGEGEFPIHPRLPLPRNHPEADQMTPKPVVPELGDIWEGGSGTGTSKSYLSLQNERMIEKEVEQRIKFPLLKYSVE